MNPPEHIQAIYEKMIMCASTAIDLTGHHDPIFLLDPGKSGGHVIPVQGYFDNPVAKIEVAALVLSYIDYFQPETVVFISEAWSYILEDGLDISDYVALRHRYGGPQNILGAFQGLTISIETHQGLWSWNHNFSKSETGRKIDMPGTLAVQSVGIFAFFPENQIPSRERMS